jgi:hypothetical protein
MPLWPWLFLLLYTAASLSPRSSHPWFFSFPILFCGLFSHAGTATDAAAGHEKLASIGLVVPE